MKIPTFSRHSTDTADTRSADGSTVARPDDATTTHFPTAGGGAGRADRDETTADLYGAKAARTPATPADRADRSAAGRTATDLAATDRAAADRAAADRAEADRADGAMAARERDHDRAAAPRPDKKPRASLMATLGLILGVVSALLVLSGPLLGYGIVLAVPALLVSVLGFLATRRRHVAGKSDALIGIVLSLAAIVVGALALTGSLSWLGTDMQTVTSLRDWLDARFVDRF